MRKDLCDKQKTCECNHSWTNHEDDGQFYVECKVEGCDCEEYDEKE